MAHQHLQARPAFPAGEGGPEGRMRSSSGRRGHGTSVSAATPSLPRWGRWPGGPDEVLFRQARTWHFSICSHAQPSPIGEGGPEGRMRSSPGGHGHGISASATTPSLPRWGRWPGGPDEVQFRQARLAFPAGVGAERQRGGEGRHPLRRGSSPHCRFPLDWHKPSLSYGGNVIQLIRQSNMVAANPS